MSELKIPDAAYDVMTNASSESGGLRKAAPLIVAAELRRQAALLHKRALYEYGEEEQYIIRSVAHQLEYRSDALDPQGVTK